MNEKAIHNMISFKQSYSQREDLYLIFILISTKDKKKWKTAFCGTESNCIIQACLHGAMSTAFTHRGVDIKPENLILRVRRALAKSLPLNILTNTTPLRFRTDTKENISIQFNSLGLSNELERLVSKHSSRGKPCFDIRFGCNIEKAINYATTQIRLPLSA